MLLAMSGIMFDQTEHLSFTTNYLTKQKLRQYLVLAYVPT
jgi:hypothetical protein